MKVSSYLYLDSDLPIYPGSIIYLHLTTIISVIPTLTYIPRKIAQASKPRILPSVIESLQAVI